MGIDDDDSPALVHLDSTVRRLVRRVEVLERHLVLLAEHCDVDLDALVARDDVDRLGELVADWRTLELAGIDPTTGEVAG